MSAPPPLPTPRQLLTHLLKDPLPPPPPPPPPPPLIAEPPPDKGPHTRSGPVSQSLKPLLITLHAIFPTELLPALDLLDRGLVTRHVSSSSASESPAPLIPPPRVYYVQSSKGGNSGGRKSSGGGGGDRGARGSGGRSGAGSGGGGSENTKTYEVRTRAWNCSCAAFAFAAVHSAATAAATTASARGGSLDEDKEEEEEGQAAEDGHGYDYYKDDSEECSFGGLGRGNECPPICKHLMACVLAERLGLSQGERGGGGDDDEMALGRVGGMMQPAAAPAAGLPVPVQLKILEVGVEERWAWGAGWGG
ncbi:MAG: hypothetical protein M1825_001865 [Sarcosagium campestre]|nr:MAG: hypothetical protein M1825_001865 [Sarcosagium campestre]